MAGSNGTDEARAEAMGRVALVSELAKSRLDFALGYAIGAVEAGSLSEEPAALGGARDSFAEIFAAALDGFDDAAEALIETSPAGDPDPVRAFFAPRTQK